MAIEGRDIAVELGIAVGAPQRAAQVKSDFGIGIQSGKRVSVAFVPAPQSEARCREPEITGHICSKLGIHPGETTDDGKFTVSLVECLGSCGTAPMMQIGFDYHENLTPKKVDKMLAESD